MSTNTYPLIAVLLLILGLVLPQQTAGSVLGRSTSGITYSPNNQLALRYLSFNPFTLTTSRASNSATGNQAESTAADTSSQPEMSAPDIDDSILSAMNTTLFSVRPPIRVPYRPPLRSPYRPPWPPLL